MVKFDKSKLGNATKSPTLEQFNKLLQNKTFNYYSFHNLENESKEKSE